MYNLEKTEINRRLAWTRLDYSRDSSFVTLLMCLMEEPAGTRALRRYTDELPLFVAIISEIVFSHSLDISYKILPVVCGKERSSIGWLEK